VKTQTRAPGEDVTVHVGHDMTADEMQLTLSRIYAIATLDPEMTEFAASLEDALRKLIAARIARDRVGSRDPLHKLLPADSYFQNCLVPASFFQARWAPSQT
jgi:hypothetical protein